MIPTANTFHIDDFPPGRKGRVRLFGKKDIEFEFYCEHEDVILDDQISSPKSVFVSLIHEIIEGD